jgi:hypothetical protein
MKTIRQRLADTLGWGFTLWLIGFALGMMLFPFVPTARLGWFIVPILTAVGAVVAYRRLRYEEESFRYYILIGFTWLAVAAVLDYIFLV